jgi:hypothetical protein
MKAYSVWETRLKPEGAEQGFAITKQIWVDMQSFEGYEGHMLLRDQDDPGHLLLISLWTTRMDADKALKLYPADNPNVKALQPLLLKQRARAVYDVEEIFGDILG